MCKLMLLIDKNVKVFQRPEDNFMQKLVCMLFDFALGLYSAMRMYFSAIPIRIFLYSIIFIQITRA